MEIFVSIGFISGWLGVICCILSFILLTLKSQEQIKKIQNNPNTDENEHFKQDTIFLLINAFGCTIFTCLYCAYYGTLGSDPTRLNIKITQNICQYTAQYMANAGWQLSRYFFYNFMLWRIKASFREPESLKLSKITFIIYIILIHLWLIFVLSISIFFTPRKLTTTGRCGVIVKEIFNNFTTSDIRTIAWAFDFSLTTCLLFLFLKRLYQLTQENNRINKYKRKTIILGTFATLTSVTMALVIYFMVTKEWRYFIPIDQIVNLSCVVFTFKFNINTLCPNCCNNNKINECKHTNIKQESTFSAQPNDSQVWNILCKSERNGEIDNKDQININTTDTTDIEMT
eukprot:529903_1